MLIFVFSGVDGDTVIDLVDRTIKKNEENPVNIFYFGSSNMLEISCYDSEIGNQYTGAQAMAILIECRKKVLFDD